MRRSELIVFAYLGYLTVLAWTLRLPRRRRLVATVAAVAVAAVIVLLAEARPSLLGQVARDWLPAVYLLIGYWLSGLFFTRPQAAVEAWLLGTDGWLLSTGPLRTLVEGRPRLVAEYFEAAYLGCYALIPLGLAVVYFLFPSVEPDRYWTTVLAAEYGCYGMLPWIQTRPPRAVDPSTAVRRRRVALRGLNEWILRRGSIQVNTVPSGHAAGALAAALIVWTADPFWGTLFLVAAFSIGLGSVVGRYHYAADALLGFAWAFAVWWMAG